MENDIENPEVPQSDETEDIGEKLKMGIMGQHIRAGHAKVKPIGDRMINAVRGAIWEAWEMGLDDSDESTYPSIPVLDREAVEPDEPEI
jgi:hypothetical protein